MEGVNGKTDQDALTSQGTGYNIPSDDGEFNNYILFPVPAA